MKKKKLQELIENAKQNEKVIYQRYNGLITKYIDNGDYYIGCNTGIAIEKNEHLLLGKVSENIIDLIEVGDFVNGYRVENVINEGPCPSGKCVDIDSSKDSIECTLWEKDIKTILTKESYMANCYKVGGRE